MPVFEWRSIMPVPVDELFAYHARPGAFERLAPPWQRLRILEQEGGMRDGGRVVFKVYVGPVGKRWVAEMGSYVEGRQFVDRQVEGPFASWEHTHRFLPGADDGASELLDHIEYSLPGVSPIPSVQDRPASSSSAFAASATRARAPTSSVTPCGRTALGSGWRSAAPAA